MNILAFNILQTFGKLAQESGFGGFVAAGGWKNLIMVAIACVLLWSLENTTPRLWPGPWKRGSPRA